MSHCCKLFNVELVGRQPKQPPWPCASGLEALTCERMLSGRQAALNLKGEKLRDSILSQVSSLLYKGGLLCPHSSLISEQI